MKSAFELLVKDIKRYKMALLVLAAYVLVFKVLLHDMCPLVFVTGLPCPACGLTRAGIALLTGQFGTAFGLHPFIYVIAGYCAILFVKRYFLKMELKHVRNFLIIFMILLIVFYLYRMIRYFPSTPPISYYYDSLLARLIRLFGRS